MAIHPFRLILIFLVLLSGTSPGRAGAGRPFHENVPFPGEIKQLEPALRKLNPNAWVLNFQETLDYRDMKSRAWLVTYAVERGKFSFTYDYACFSDTGKLLTLFSRDLPGVLPPDSTRFNSKFPGRAIMFRLNDSEMGVALFSDAWRTLAAPVPGLLDFEHEERCYDFNVFKITAGKGKQLFHESWTFTQTLAFQGWIKVACFVDLTQRGQMDLLIERNVYLHGVALLDRSVYLQTPSGVFEEADPVITQKGLAYLTRHRPTQSWPNGQSWINLACPRLVDDDSRH